MEKLNSNKGQVLSIDFSIAIFLFVVVISSLIVNRNLMLNKIDRQEGVIDKMKLEAVFDSLLLQPGEPENWNTSDVKVLGLVDEPNELNGTKLLYFLKIPYDRSQNLLGIGDMFYFEVTKKGEVVAYNGTKLTKGSKTWNEEDEVVVSERTGFLNESLVKLKMVKW